MNQDKTNIIDLTIELMREIGLESPLDVRQTVYDKCQELYNNAKINDDLETYGTKYEFINCNSTDFYKTLTEAFEKSPAMGLFNKAGTEKYFLIYKDRVEKRFRPIMAIHEAVEYELGISGTDQESAHNKASIEEIKKAEELNLKIPYLKYIKETYPNKFKQLEELKLVS
jgi:uncharacterized radical SAM superfamily Fe-S cluster-containing enzyme